MHLKILFPRPKERRQRLGDAEDDGVVEKGAKEHEPAPISGKGVAESTVAAEAFVVVETVNVVEELVGKDISVVVVVVVVVVIAPVPFFIRHFSIIWRFFLRRSRWLWRG